MFCGPLGVHVRRADILAWRTHTQQGGRALPTTCRQVPLEHVAAGGILVSPGAFIYIHFRTRFGPPRRGRFRDRCAPVMAIGGCVLLRLCKARQGAINIVMGALGLGLCIVMGDAADGFAGLRGWRFGGWSFLSSLEAGFIWQLRFNTC